MESIVEQMKQLLSVIEEGIKEQKFPETSRIYIQQFGRQIRETLSVIEVILKENTLQTGISPSSRSAMYNLRRAFYATLFRLSKEEGIDRPKSQEEWKKAASKLIETFEKTGISEAPCKVVLTYEIAEEDGVKYIRFKDASILYFELEGVIRVDIE